MILNHLWRCLEIFLSLSKTLGPQEGPPMAPKDPTGDPLEVQRGSLDNLMI